MEEHELKLTIIYGTNKHLEVRTRREHREGEARVPWGSSTSQLGAGQLRVEDEDRRQG